jgi:hypothetical protein
MVTTCRSCTTVSEGAVMGLGLRLHLAKAQWLLSRLRQLILHSHFCTCCTLAKVNG